MANFTGTAGDDVQDGTSGDDTFDFAQGGNDTLNGLEGDDTFLMGAKMTGADRIDGGDGFDTLVLNGNYASYGGALEFDRNTISGIERITLVAGNSYELQIDAKNVRPQEWLTIDGTALGQSNFLEVFTRVSASGHFVILGGNGDDDLIGGPNGDKIFGGAGDDRVGGANGIGADLLDGGTGDDEIAASASDLVIAGDGNDQILISLDAPGVTAHLRGINGGNGDDRIDIETAAATPFHVGEGSLDGGDGYDTLEIDGIITIDMATFSAATTGIERLTWFSLPGSVTENKLMGNAASNTFDLRSFDITYNISVAGGGGNDILIGGARSNILDGGLGADDMRGGRSADIFVYHDASESTGRHYDVIRIFDTLEDKINLPDKPVDVDAHVTVGDLSNPSFDTDLSSLLNAGVFGAGHAVLVTPNSGGLAAKTFLVVDANGMDGYQPGEDFVIRLANLRNVDDFGLDSFS